MEDTAIVVIIGVSCEIELGKHFCSLMIRPVAQMLPEGWQAARGHTGSMYLDPDSRQ